MIIDKLMENILPTLRFILIKSEIVRENPKVVKLLFVIQFVALLFLS